MVRRIREEIIEDDVPVREVLVERRVRRVGFAPNPAAIMLAILVLVALLVLLAGAL